MGDGEKQTATVCVLEDTEELPRLPGLVTFRLFLLRKEISLYLVYASFVGIAYVQPSQTIMDTLLLIFSVTLTALLQGDKRRPREVKALAQGHTAGSSR